MLRPRDTVPVTHVTQQMLRPHSTKKRELSPTLLLYDNDTNHRKQRIP